MCVFGCGSGQLDGTRQIRSVRQLAIGCDQRSIEGRRQGEICGVVGAELTAKRPYRWKQRPMGMPLDVCLIEHVQSSLRPVTIKLPTSSESPEGTDHLDVEEVGSMDVLSCQTGENLGPPIDCVDESRCVDNDHSRRPARTAAAACPPRRDGVEPASATSSSRGRWATNRSNSALRNSERLIPARAARTFSSRCTSSLTLRI